MTDRLDVQPEHRVLEIGTGSGYQTAVLCRLARRGVYDRARQAAARRGVRAADGSGHPQRALQLRRRHDRLAGAGAPFDRISIAAGAPELPQQVAARASSKDGGIAVLPVGPEDEQMLVVGARGAATS